MYHQVKKAWSITFSIVCYNLSKTEKKREKLFPITHTSYVTFLHTLNISRRKHEKLVNMVASDMENCRTGDEER